MEFTGKIFRYKCPMCAMMCESEEALANHMESEKLLKKIVCEDCGKRFKTKEGYRWVQSYRSYRLIIGSFSVSPALLSADFNKQ